MQNVDIYKQLLFNYLLHTTDIATINNVSTTIDDIHTIIQDILKDKGDNNDIHGTS